MRAASFKTLHNSRKTRQSYAYRAIERDSMSGDSEVESKADEAMVRLNRGNMSKEEMLEWATREQEWRQLNG